MGNRITCWLDPGKTNGLASWDSRDGGTFTSLEAPDLMALGHWLELLIVVNDSELCGDDDGRAIELGWERYIITPGSTRHGTADWSLEAIGVARYLALKHNLTILPPQTSSMMATSTDKRLKLVNWYKPGKPHANDASRHLMRYMTKAGTLPFELWNKVFCDDVLSLASPKHEGVRFISSGEDHCC